MAATGEGTRGQGPEEEIKITRGVVAEVDRTVEEGYNVGVQPHLLKNAKNNI